MHLRNVNLNLLPILQALLHEKSVSDAAIRLSMSQSAVSEALAKLRSTLDDPLLVRVGGRMDLTPRAIEMLNPLDDICRTLITFMQRPIFDAANAQHTFVIASGDYGTNRVARRLLEAVRTRAPGVTLRFLKGGDELLAGLAARDIDFAIIPDFFIEEFAPTPLRYIPLFEDRAVVILDKRHPLAPKEIITQEDLDEYRLIAFHPGSARIERRHLHSFSGGKSFKISALVPEVALVPKLVRGSLDFGIIPSGFRDSPADYPDIVERPMSFSDPLLRVGLAWSPIQDADVGHRWLREIICSAELN